MCSQGGLADISLPRPAFELSITSMPMGSVATPPPQRMQLDTKGCQFSPLASDVESLSGEVRRGPSVQIRRANLQATSKPGFL